MERKAGLIVRRFEGDTAHAAAIAEFLGRREDPSGQRAGWHPGDFWWQAYRASCPAVFTTFSQDGRIRAIAIFRPPGDFEVVLDPTGRGTADGDALVETVRNLLTSGPGMAGPLRLTVPDHDEWMAAIAESLSLANTNQVEIRTSWVALDAPLPVTLLEGFRLVAMEAGADLDARVQLHREVWEPSRFSRDEYDCLREAQGYRADLDLVACAADGTYASYAIGWFDPIARTGLLEPVGTGAAFRGKGLGKAVIATVLNRLQSLGAIGCWVVSYDDDVPSNALYRSVGFRQATRWSVWAKADLAQTETETETETEKPD